MWLVGDDTYHKVQYYLALLDRQKKESKLAKAEVKIKELEAEVTRLTILCKEK